MSQAEHVPGRTLNLLPWLIRVRPAVLAHKLQIAMWLRQNGSSFFIHTLGWYWCSWWRHFSYGDDSGVWASPTLYFCLPLDPWCYLHLISGRRRKARSYTHFLKALMWSWCTFHRLELSHMASQASLVNKNKGLEKRTYEVWVHSRNPQIILRFSLFSLS